MSFTDDILNENKSMSKTIELLKNRIKDFERVELEQEKIICHIEAERDELKAKLAEFQEFEFHPDWSMLEATRDSLKEHMRLLKAANAEVGRLQGIIDRACNEFDKHDHARTPAHMVELYKARSPYRGDKEQAPTPATDATDESETK